MNLKAAIYDPYLDTLGGGERYCLTIAEILLNSGYHVDLFWSKDSDIVNQAAKRFSLNLEQIIIKPDIFRLAYKPISHEVQPVKSVSHPLATSLITKSIELIKRWQITRHYDLMFYLSDGSIPFLFSKKNYLHIQVPFSRPVSAFDRLKMGFFQANIYNSKFTQSYYPSFPNNVVIYPPVDIDSYMSKAPKNKTILSVGRFDNILNTKRQDVLINAFRLLSQHQAGWQLILAGGSMVSEKNNIYIQHLKELSKSLPVKIIVNPSYSELTNLFQSAPIYWHAAGYQVNQEEKPEATEHFGITVVEAMAAGAVPLVVNRGGLPEIITQNQDGFLWDTIDQLISKTRLLIASPKLLSEMSGNAILTSSKFSKLKFQEKFENLINHGIPKI